MYLLIVHHPLHNKCLNELFHNVDDSLKLKEGAGKTLFKVLLQHKMPRRAG